MALLAAELLARAPFALRAPGLLLYPPVLYLAYRHGLRTGLVAALVAGVYVAAFAWRFQPAVADPLPRLALALLVVPAAAALVGRLRDRVEGLLRREEEARLAAEAAAERTRQVLEGVADGFMMFDSGWRITFANHAARVLLHRHRDALVGEEARSVLTPTLYHEFYRRCQEAARKQTPLRFEASAPSGTWFEVHAVPSPDGMAVHFRDVTERRQHEEKLRSMTLVDELTGLYNRRGFFALAEQQTKLAERKHRGLLLVFADLDDLKTINDTHGHTAGDQALFEAAAVLRATFRETDVVARIGGDEFAALVLETEPDSAALLVERLQTNLRQANEESTLPFGISLSCGVAGFAPDGALPIGDLLSLADHRMYEQKRAKRHARG